MNPADFLDDAIAERDAAIEARVREEIAAELQGQAWQTNGEYPAHIAYLRAANIARGGAA